MNETYQANHLSAATQTAIHFFARHHSEKFYTARMLEIETATLEEIPSSEMAEYVRITTLIQNHYEPPGGE